VPAASFHYFNWLVPSIPTHECLNINMVPQSTANKGLAEEVRRRNEWMENTMVERISSIPSTPS
jgi:hypothetical protein